MQKTSINITAAGVKISDIQLTLPDFENNATFYTSDIIVPVTGLPKSRLRFSIDTAKSRLSKKFFSFIITTSRPLL
jgi:hypothetical protein